VYARGARRTAILNFEPFTGGREFTFSGGLLVDTGGWAVGTEPNMAEQRTLSDFIGRTARLFPAEHYGLIMWDHGDSNDASTCRFASIGLRRHVTACQV
jgi:hypothetical protein